MSDASVLAIVAAAPWFGHTLEDIQVCPPRARVASPFSQCARRCVAVGSEEGNECVFVHRGGGARGDSNGHRDTAGVCVCVVCV